MKADLVAREPQRLQQWETTRVYQRIQAQRRDAQKFILHDGPPFANGDVHIGTALNKILKDIIVKYKTLRGFNTPYVPGWDCHGLPIEFKVTQEMRKAGQTTAEPATIRRACEAYARKYIDLQRDQFKRLGIFGEWENPYLTLDKAYEADELRLFADVVEKGFVYRGKKPVYWSIPCRTALAEAEVEYQDHLSPSIYVKFPLVGHPNTSIVIWTTTPWTLPANLAVAYNSTFSYSHVRVGDHTYLLSTFLLGKLAEKFGWPAYEILRSVDADQLASLEFQHPFCDRRGKLFPGDNFVDNATGTGFVHIAPGHGLEDYLLGQQQGLPIYSPVDDDGRFAYTDDLPVEQQMPAGMVGKSILEKQGKSEANVAVLDELRARNALIHQENYSHSYPFCWRSKTPVIFRAMDQWFIEIDHDQFRKRALDAIAEVTWIPPWGQSRIEAAVKSRPDWCISRQRSWGVPIPAFYDADNRAILDPEIIRNTAKLVEQHGSNIWFEKSAAELWQALKPRNWSGPEPVSKSADTLDVWIDSGSSSRAVLMRRPELRSGLAKEEGPVQDAAARHDWRADIYSEGSDQHRGWFQSSLLLSLAGNDAAPYKTVLTHGFLVDADKEKISKSKQSGYEKPQTADAYVTKWGADIVRLWVASQDCRNDIVVSDERISKVAETYRLLRNTLRYQLSNLYDFDPIKDALTDDQLTGLDRWILQEFSRLEQQIAVAYDAYEFHVVYQKLSQFAAVELSSMYHDLVKDRLYTDAADSLRRRSTQTILHRMATALCQMLSPIMVFTAEEAVEFLPRTTEQLSVHASQWEPAPFKSSADEEETWKTLFAIRQPALAELEKARQAKVIGKALEAKVSLAGPPHLLRVAGENLEPLRELLNVSQLEIPRESTGASEIVATVERAEGEKCERCWRWEKDVGSDASHPTLCARCVSAIAFALPEVGGKPEPA